MTGFVLQGHIFGRTTIFTQKWLVNFTSNYKETASNIELNVKFWSIILTINKYLIQI